MEHSIDPKARMQKGELRRIKAETYRIVHTCGIKREWLAMRMNKDISTIFRWLNEDDSTYPGDQVWIEFAGVIREESGCTDHLTPVTQAWWGCSVASDSSRHGDEVQTVDGLMASITLRWSRIQAHCLQGGGLSAVAHDIASLEVSIKDLASRVPELAVTA